MRAVVAVLAWLTMMSVGVAAPVAPAEREAVLAVFQAWNKAVLAGKLDEAMALRSADRRRRMAPDIKTAAQRRQVGELLKSMVPDSVEVLHASASRDGTKITLQTVITLVVPAGPARAGMPPPGTKLQAELGLDFVREGRAWKFDNQTWGMDPAKIKPCTASWQGMGVFEERDNLQMGGQIRRVSFGDDHTVVVIRMFDAEACIFLPSKARLVELGFDVTTLVPYGIIEIEAWPHVQDEQAVWAASLRMIDEE